MNKELILQIANAIEKDPKSYDQSTWVCDGAYCLAGHACALAEGGKHQNGLFGRQLYTSDEYEQLFGRDPDDGLFWYSVPARQFLDINENLADQIFYTLWKPIRPLSVPAALRQWANTGDPHGCMIPD